MFGRQFGHLYLPEWSVCQNKKQTTKKQLKSVLYFEQSCSFQIPSVLDYTASYLPNRPEMSHCSIFI